MISYLTGTVHTKGLNYLILLTHGVGYKVFTPMDVLTQITLNSLISLHTYTYVKEDILALYGFTTSDDLALFELFLSVSGIGPKTAIAIFGNGKATKIKEAIVKGDVDFFTNVPRLGKKNAQKIIIELRSKLGSLAELDLALEGGETKEIIDALKSFGFSISEAKEAVNALKDIEGDTSVKIKEALKFLGKK